MNGLPEVTNKLSYRKIQINGINELIKEILVDDLTVEPTKYKQEVFL